MIASNAFAATVSRKSLVDALRVLGKVVERRNTIPILANVLLVAGRDCLTIIGTDLDLQAETELPADCQPGGSITLSLAALTAAATKSKAEHATLTDVGGAVVFACGGTVRLPVLPVGDFPQIVRGDLGARFAVPVAQLRDDLARVRIVVSTEETRYYLNGVFMHRYEGGEFRMVATDGHRMAMISRPAPDGMPHDLADSIVPRKAIDVLQFILKRDKADGNAASLAFSRSKVDIRVGRWRLLSKLVDGTFPDYTRVIPSYSEGTVATVDAEGFAAFVRETVSHVTERTKAIALSWRSGESWVVGSATDPNTGRGMNVGTGEFTAPDGRREGDYVTGYNAGYLAEMLDCCTGPVQIIQDDCRAPAKFVPLDQPELTMVLMPMRVGDTFLTPDDVRRLSRSPLDVLREEGPRLLIDAVDADVRRDARKRHGPMVTAAIEHLAGGGDRRAARLAVLHMLAEGACDHAGAARLKRMADLQPASSFRAWEAGLGKVQPVAEPVARIQIVEPDPAPVESHGGEDDAEPEPAPVPVPTPSPSPQPSEAVPVPAEEPVAEGAPMFRTLQNFKAAAGVGSRWRKRMWRDGAWIDSPEGTRTVARVQARDVAFVAGDHIDAETAAMLGRNKAGLMWLGFPKAGCWRSDGAGLIVTYPDGTPNIRFDPLPPLGALGAVEADQANAVEAPAVEQSDDVAALRAMVAALTARLDRLESASQGVASEGGVSEGGGAESSPALASADEATVSEHIRRSPAHERAVRRAWRERSGRRWQVRNLVESVDVATAQETMERNNAARLQAMVDSVTMADLAETDALRERAVNAEATVARLKARVSRLGVALAGRKEQLGRALRDLGFARDRGAELQRERDEALASVAGRRSPLRTVASSVTYAMGGGRKAG